MFYKYAGEPGRAGAAARGSGSVASRESAGENVPPPPGQLPRETSHWVRHTDIARGGPGLRGSELRQWDALSPSQQREWMVAQPGTGGMPQLAEPRDATGARERGTGYRRVTVLGLRGPGLFRGIPSQGKQHPPGDQGPLPGCSSTTDTGCHLPGQGELQLSTPAGRASSKESDKAF